MKLCDHTQLVVPTIDPGTGKPVQYKCVCGKEGKMAPEIYELVQKVTRQWNPSQYRIGLHGPTEKGSTVVITDSLARVNVRVAKGKSLEAALKNVLKRIA